MRVGGGGGVVSFLRVKEAATSALDGGDGANKGPKKRLCRPFRLAAAAIELDFCMAHGSGHHINTNMARTDGTEQDKQPMKCLQI
jgi:hypothetical protein